MKGIRKTVVFLVILLIPMLLAAPVALGAQDSEYIKETKIASGESQEDVIRRLQDEGYTPVMKNIAEEKPELASDYVYIGYRTTTNPDESIEGRGSEFTGSVFGDAALMIGGGGVILGVVIGMISMRIRPKVTKNAEKADSASKTDAGSTGRDLR